MKQECNFQKVYDFTSTIELLEVTKNNTALFSIERRESELFFDPEKDTIEASWGEGNVLRLDNYGILLTSEEEDILWKMMKRLRREGKL